MKHRAETKRQVLVVSGEEHALNSCKLHLEVNGISDVLTLSDNQKVLPLLDRERVAVAVLDLSDPDVPDLVKDRGQPGLF